MKTARVLIPLFSLPLALSISSALAQDTSDDDDTEAGILEEVLVTASRRGDQDIMTTPVSITALNGEDTQKFAIRDLNDIAVSVPGLSAGTVSAFKSAQFAMRGVSESTIILYKESPVGVTLDEFVVPHIQTSNLDMFDIESIEVLRGPQGTLFGKNTTGGVINVRTKRPVLTENSIDARMQFGDFGTNKFMGALNIAAGDTLAFRAAFMYLQSDGYYKNNATWGPIGQTVAPFNTEEYLGDTGRGDGRSLGGDDVVNGRIKMLWSPTDNLNLLFQYEYVNDDGDVPPIVQTSGAGYVVPLWGFDPWTPDKGDPLDFAGITPRCDPEPAGICMDDGHRVDIDGYYLNGDWAFSDNYTLYFNAGRREQESRLPSSYVGTAAPISVFDATRDDNRETSQVEVRVGSNLGGSFDFTAGVFYQEDNTEFAVLQYVAFLDGFFLGTPPDYWNNFPRVLSNRQDAEAQAAYIDGTWQVTDRFQITAGFRYTNEEKAWAGRPMRQFFDGQPLLEILDEPLDATDFERFPEGVVYDNEDWSEPTYRLIFGYDFSEDTYGFIGYSRGFKSGGYNDQLGTQLDPITPLAARPTDPEIADSFEGGVKHTFADGAATIAVNAYYVEYTDAQRTFNVSFPGGGQETLFFNAAELDVKGVEAEGAWAVTDAFTLNYNISWMDAKFGKFEADTNYDGEIDVDLSGQPVTRAPEWMGSVEGTYIMPFLDRYNLEFRGRVSYEDDSIQAYSDVDPVFNTVLDERTLVDASITLTNADNDWYVRLLGSNLTDERYKTGSLSVATLWIMSAYGPPRYYGVEFGAFFDW
jgi:iron complex outermembrane receptor protein